MAGNQQLMAHLNSKIHAVLLSGTESIQLVTNKLTGNLDREIHAVLLTDTERLWLVTSN